MTTKIKPEDYGRMRWQKERPVGNPWEFLPCELDTYTLAVEKAAAEKAWLACESLIEEETDDSHGKITTVFYSTSKTFDEWWAEQQKEKK